MNKIKSYTYYLLHIPTGKKYYGARWANIGLNLTPDQDFWNVYFSSSEAVQLLLEQDGKESFRAEIRKTFDTPEEACAWEHKVLRRMKAVQREDWLNQANYPEEFYCDNSGENHPMYDRSYHDVWVEKYGKEEADRRQEETNKKNSLALKEYFKNPEAREKNSLARKEYYKNPEAREKNSLALKEYFKNPEAREKNSLARKEYYKNPEAREKNSLALKEYFKNPEAREKTSLALKEYFKNPEAREKTSLALKEYFKNPEAKLKQAKSSGFTGAWVIHKDGRKIFIENQHQFARDYNLNRGHLNSVINGKAKSHKGWKLANLSKEEITKLDKR